MDIKLNGESRTVSAGVSLTELLKSLNVQPEIVAVELNEEVVPRSKHPQTILKDGDAVEIVRMVGGGSLSSVSLSS